jgi:glycosyltransferase involved in cell wall biosynthesis
MIKILFILPSLRFGGAERVISFVCQNLNPSKYEVTLLVIGFKNDQKIDVKNVNLIFLGKQRLLFSIPKIYNYLIKNRPNIVVGSIGHINVFLGAISLIFSKIKFIGREASVTEIMSRYSKKKLPYWLEAFFYSQLDKIICQSEDMKESFIKLYHYQSNKCLIINNPITFDMSFLNHIDNVKRKSTKIFITVGRLSEEKGYERILRVLHMLQIDFHYIIIGDGPLKNDIKKIVLDLNLTSKVTIIDHTDKVQNLLLEATLYLQGSYVEGFPNALLEATASGVPVIAFNSPGGTREIVENGINGFLVETQTEYKNAILEGYYREWHKREIIENIYKKFNKEKILKKYCQLFDSMV